MAKSIVFRKKNHLGCIGFEGSAIYHNWPSILTFFENLRLAAVSALLAKRLVKKLILLPGEKQPIGNRDSINERQM